MNSKQWFMRTTAIQSVFLATGRAYDETARRFQHSISDIIVWVENEVRRLQKLRETPDN